MNIWAITRPHGRHDGSEIAPPQSFRAVSERLSLDPPITRFGLRTEGTVPRVGVDSMPPDVGPEIAHSRFLLRAA